MYREFMWFSLSLVSRFIVPFCFQMNSLHSTTEYLLSPLKAKVCTVLSLFSIFHSINPSLHPPCSITLPVTLSILLYPLSTHHLVIPPWISLSPYPLFYSIFHPIIPLSLFHPPFCVIKRSVFILHLQTPSDPGEEDRTESQLREKGIQSFLTTPTS